MPLVPVAEGDPHVPAHNEERDAINDLEDGVAARIPFPVSPTLGSMLRWDGDKWASSKMRIFEGIGSPEGVVAAPVGSRYVDVTGASGNAEYIKATGTGNTGWSVLNQDSGWQAIVPGTGWQNVSGAPALARMINDVVYLRGRLERVSGAGLTAGTIPLALRPTEELIGNARWASEHGLCDVHINGTITVSGLYDTSADLYLASISTVPYKRS